MALFTFPQLSANGLYDHGEVYVKLADVREWLTNTAEAFDKFEIEHGVVTVPGEIGDVIRGIRNCFQSPTHTNV